MRSVLATEGAALYVLKRLEVRFEASCWVEDMVNNVLWDVEYVVRREGFAERRKEGQQRI